MNSQTVIFGVEGALSGILEEVARRARRPAAEDHARDAPPLHHAHDRKSRGRHFRWRLSELAAPPAEISISKFWRNFKISSKFRQILAKFSQIFASKIEESKCKKSTQAKNHPEIRTENRKHETTKRKTKPYSTAAARREQHHYTEEHWVRHLPIAFSGIFWSRDGRSSLIFKL